MKNPLSVAWFLVIVFPNLLHAAPLCTWHVATSGRDASGCGTSGSPCATVAYVDTNIVSAGDTVCVASGTYTGSFQTRREQVIPLRHSLILEAVSVPTPQVTSGIWVLTNTALQQVRGLGFEYSLPYHAHPLSGTSTLTPFGSRYSNI